LTTYRDAGVDPERADKLVRYIRERARNTLQEGFSGLGDFAGGFILSGYREPVIFSTTDGVGTKLKIAQEMNLHSTVGVDLVAMNVNDIITTGADPLLFLDYIATGRIDTDVLERVVDGIIEGCREAEVILAGGETAEMPDFYPEGVYDLAGFCLGVCERENVLTGEDLSEGDVLIGLRSDRGVKLTDPSDFGASVGEVLLTPTRIYTSSIKKLRRRVRIKAIAHITGGGIPGNLIRVLKEDLRAVVERSRIPENPIFLWIQELGKIPQEEMFRTFNMGVGMIVVISEEDKEPALKILKEEGFLCGYLEKGAREVSII